MKNSNSIRTRTFCYRPVFLLTFALSIMFSVSFVKAGIVSENEDTQHFKMISSLEYKGEGQFKNRVESMFTVRKDSLSGDKIRYFLSTDDFDLVGGNQQSGSSELSFVIDKRNRGFSAESEGLALFERINNQCVRSLKKVSKDNIGQTWKQSFDVSFLDGYLPDELKFTMTAIGLDTELLGEMIAVRALSEPFAFSIAKLDGTIGSIRAKINAVYVFDPAIKDIYLSISVFEAETKMNGIKENLRREVATYMTDASGVSADFSGLDKKFGKFVRKVGLTGKDLKVVKETTLPDWAQLDCLRAAHVSNICAAMACEGALNPVITVCIPATRLATLQGLGTVASAAELGTVSSSLAKSISAVGSMKIAVAPAVMGTGLGTAGVVAGATVGTVAIAGGGSGSSSSRSPASP
ncbi:hypothetical protein ACFL1G_04780 [Planctomycetota bacterium]